MKRLAPILFLLFNSCSTYDATPTEAEQLAIDATVQAWDEAGLPRGGCKGPAGVVHPGEKGFKERCWVGSDVAASCTDLRGTGVIVVAPSVDMDNEGEPVIHEAIHWLQWCAERKVDYNHEDKRLWKAVGGEDSVQSRAEEIFSESAQELDDFDAGVSTQE